AQPFPQVFEVAQGPLFLAAVEQPEALLFDGLLVRKQLQAAEALARHVETEPRQIARAPALGMRFSIEDEVAERIYDRLSTMIFIRTRDVRMVSDDRVCADVDEVSAYLPQPGPREFQILVSPVKGDDDDIGLSPRAADLMVILDGVDQSDSAPIRSASIE